MVSDPEQFERQLLTRLGMSAAEFEAYINGMRKYRDKFVAHLDALRTMNIPVLDAANASVEFYHSYLVAHEAEAGDLAAQAGQRALPASAEELREYYAYLRV